MTGQWKSVLKAFSRKLSPSRKPIRQLDCERLEDRWVPSTDVLSYRYGNSDPGVNTAETQLTPANVNVNTFGKLFTTNLDGQVYAEPLVDTGVTITSSPNTSFGAVGVHDVVFVATEHDSIYAINTSPAANGTILWQRSFTNTTTSGYTGNTPGTNINNTLGATTITSVPNGDTGSGDISPEIGITGTPVIDPTTNTMYVLVCTKEIVAGTVNYVQRLHAINLSDGTDQVTPYMLGDTTNGNDNDTSIYVYGTGDGNVADPYPDGKPAGTTVVQFNALREADRQALTLNNGQVYITFASHGDNGPYHGWVLAFNVTSLQSSGMQLSGVLCTSPNEGLAGIWGGGGALAFEPDGSAFYFETGNGYGGNPTLNAQGFPTDANYSEAVIKAEIDPTTSPDNQNANGWGLKIADYFIPYNVTALDNADTDFGSGSPLVLPASAGIPGHPNLLLASGKEGKIYVIDRNNMGKFSPTNDNVLNAVPDGSGQNTPPVQLGGSLSTAAYYNGQVYWTSGYGGTANTYTIGSTGQLTITSSTPETFGYLPGPIEISADGTNDGIAWVLDRNANEIHAYTATALSTELWNSAEAVGGGDGVGALDKMTEATVANGELFVGTGSNTLVVYGLTVPPSAVPQAPTLSATPTSGSSVDLSWTDPSVSPNTATGYSIEESNDGVNFSQATTAPAGETSIALGGLKPQTEYWFRIQGFNTIGDSAVSNVASATTLLVVPGLDFSQGFASASSKITLNGSATIAGSDLQLTDGGAGENGSAFATTPIDITNFTSQFTFQTTAGANTADGFTFTIQGVGATALGPDGEGLGFGSATTGGIGNSVAVKFDLYSDNGEGPDSTGLYVDGADPTNTGSIDLTASGLDFHSGDLFQANLSYDGTTLTVVIKDTVTGASATQTYVINIPNTIGNGIGYVGFTGSTGGATSTQDITTWTFFPTATSSPNTPSGLGASPATATSVVLNWTNNAGNQSGFHLDRATDPNFTQNLITETVPSSPNTFTDTTGVLAPGGTYYYRIRAYNAVGDSGNSNVAVVTIPVAPPKPTGQVVTAVTSTEIDISWQDNAGHLATGYAILRAVNHGSFTQVASLPLTSRTPPSTYTWADTDLTPGTYYEYHIEAVNTSGNNDFAGVNATTLPSPPVVLQAVPTSGGTVITWSDPPGAVSFNVYRGNSSGGETLLQAGVTGTSFTDITAQNGRTYYYTVTAVNSNSAPLPSVGAPSNEVSTLATVYTWLPTAPGTYSWTNTANWSASNGVTGYPHIATDVADINDTLTGNQTIDLGSAVTVGALNLGDAGGAHSFSLVATGGTLTFNSGSPNPAALNLATAANASETISIPITLATPLTVSITGTGTAYVTGAIGQSGTQTLTVAGTGTLSLGGTDTYTGGTVLDGGVVTASSATAFGTGTVDFAGGSYAFSPSPGLTQGQINNANPNAANGEPQGFDVVTPNPANAGSTLNFATGENSTIGGNPWNNDQTWVYTGEFYTADGSVAFAKNVDDDTLVKIDGVQYLNNTSWNTPVTTGRIQLTPGWHTIEVRFGNGGGGAGPVGGDGWIQGGPGVGYGFGMATDTSPGWANITSIAVPGGNGFVQTGNGTSSDETYGGNYFDPTDPGNGTLFRTAPLAFTNTVVATGTGVATFLVPAGVTATVTSSLSGTGGLNVSGGGVLLTTGSDTLSGPTTVAGGALEAGSTAAVGSTSPVTVLSGGTLALNGYSQTTGSLAGGGTISNAGTSAAVLTTGGLGTSTTFSGNLTNGTSPLGLTKVGTGGLTLTGTDTNTGTTTVDGGLLAANATMTSSPVLVASGTLYGTGSVGAVTVAPGGTLDAGPTGIHMAAQNGTLSVVSLTFEPAAGSSVADLTARLNGPSSGQFDQVVTAGSVTLNNATLTLVPGTGLTAGESFDLISNPGGYPIVGTFRGLPEGGFLDVNGQEFTITYLGGVLGHDVVVTDQGPVSTYYVNSAWSGLTPGTDIPDADPVAAGNQDATFGTTAFASIGAALAAAPAHSTIIVNGGNYPEAISLTTADAVVFQYAAASVEQLTASATNATISLNSVSLSIGQGATSPSAIATPILGTGSLIATGTLPLTLATANLYSGGTTVSSGTLVLGTSSAIPNESAVTVSSGATLRLNGNSLAVSSLAGSGTVTDGAAANVTLTVGGDNSNSSLSASLTDGSGGGKLSLVKAGTGTLSVGAATSTYSGGTLASAGTVAFGAPNTSPLGTGSVTLNPTTVLDENGQTVSVTSLTFAGGTVAGTGGGSLSITSTGTALNFTTAYSAAIPAVAATAGITLTSASGGSIVKSYSGTPTNTPVIAGTLNLGSFNRTFSIDETDGDSAGLILSGPVIGTGGIIVNNGAGNTGYPDLGTLDLTNNANSYSGGTSIVDGRVEIGAANALGAISGGVAIGADGVLGLATTTPTTFAPYPVTITRSTNLGDYLYDLGDDSGSNTWTGPITLVSGAGAEFGVATGATLTVTGSISQSVSPGTLSTGTLPTPDYFGASGSAGTLLLAGTNSYTGPTAINNGTVEAGSSTAFGVNSAVTVASGAEVLVDGNSLAISSLVGPAGSTVANGSGTPGTLSLGGSTNTSFPGLISDGGGSPLTVVKTGTGTLTLGGSNSYSGGTTITAGTVSLLSNTALGSGTITLAGGTIATGVATPGLTEGLITGNAFDTTDPNPGGATTLNFRLGEINTLPPWGSNETWVYTGEFYTADGSVAFAKNIDDNTLLKIDGVTYINNTNYNQPATTGQLELSPGWHAIEVRFGNGNGGAGPVPGNGWTATFGFGMATDTSPGWANIAPGETVGVGGNGIIAQPAPYVSIPQGTDYNFENLANQNVSQFGPTDPGTGSLFRTASFATSIANPVVLASPASDISVGLLGATFTGPITGASPLTKTGTGTLTLAGINTYSGGDGPDRGQHRSELSPGPRHRLGPDPLARNHPDTGWQ